MEFRHGRPFNNPSSHVCRWLTRTKMPITATVECGAPSSRKFQDDSTLLWLSIRSRTSEEFFRSPRFVASSRIETLSSFRLGNRFFIALMLLSHFSASQDKLFLCRESDVQSKTELQTRRIFNFCLLQFAIFSRSFAGRGQSGRLKENFPSRKNEFGVWTFISRKAPLSIKHFPQATPNPSRH